MSLGKKNIVKNINTKTQISISHSTQLLEIFIEIIKSNFNDKKVKLSNFGTFYLHTSPPRHGRNPKTKESYPIPQIKKIAFKPSNYIKSNMN